MKWPWRRRAELCEPRIRADSKLVELETAKEILAEIFHTQPSEVEEMIQSRLEERNWLEEKEIWPEELGESCGLRLFAWVNSYGPKFRELG